MLAVEAEIQSMVIYHPNVQYCIVHVYESVSNNSTIYHIQTNIPSCKMYMKMIPTHHKWADPSWPCWFDVFLPSVLSLTPLYKPTCTSTLQSQLANKLGSNDLCLVRCFSHTVWKNHFKGTRYQIKLTLMSFNNVWCVLLPPFARNTGSRAFNLTWGEGSQY